jgi:hypothetical protein
MINKIIIENGLKKILADIGKLPEKQMLDLKVILLQEFLVDFEASDFNQAINNMILQEDFYSKLPQTRIFIKYCQKEKDKRLSEKKARELEMVKNEKQKLISIIYKFFEINRTDYLFNSLASELRPYNIEQITQAFNNLKNIDRPQIEDWRKELNKKETTSEAKNWVMPNLKADR